MTFPARIKATFRLLMARHSFALLASFLPLLLWAQSPISADDAVLQRIDELSNLPWLKNDPFVADRNALNVNGFAPGDTPRYTPEVYRQRLAILDERTPFKLTYNEPVQAYLDLYTQRKREQTGRMLGLAQLYFPVFEEALDRHGLPHELKYLAVVESALFPGARSRAAAVGLWQFMVGTGKMYGLHVDSYMDERCDVYASTDAACRYLKDLHRIFGNWELALAAYNCGPGNVNKAVRRAGGTLDYWAVYNHLPRETRGYVPAFIAVNYVFNHAADHNIYPVMQLLRLRGGHRAGVLSTGPEQAGGDHRRLGHRTDRAQSRLQTWHRSGLGGALHAVPAPYAGNVLHRQGERDPVQLCTGHEHTGALGVDGHRHTQQRSRPDPNTCGAAR